MNNGFPLFSWPCLSDYQIKKQMIRIEILEGEDIVPETILIMYQFYLSTIFAIRKDFGSFPYQMTIMYT